MSVRRQKALNCLPENKTEFEKPAASIHTVFSELLHATVKAHKWNDTEKLRLFYGFAEWCFRQNAKELWNAAGICFYEHLYSYNETREAFCKWIEKDTYKDVRVLLELSIKESELKKLDQFYK